MFSHFCQSNLSLVIIKQSAFCLILAKLYLTGTDFYDNLYSQEFLDIKTKEGEGTMKKFWLVLLFLILASTTAKAGPSVSVAWGWPMVIKGADWDQIPSSFRLGAGYSWSVGDGWSLGIAGGVRIPYSAPHFVPRVMVTSGYKVSGFFVLGAGVVYEPLPAYGGGKPSHFVGLGISPTIITKSGVGVSLVVGPGMVMNDRGIPKLYTWIFQPQITLPF
jgi:hypothetical protein